MSRQAPRVITETEYRTLWEPQGWHLLPIGPTSTWRQEWREWEAIRDIVQNSLDEAESYRWGYDAQGLWIKDYGRGVAVADFLLGPPKLKPAYARGQFGEGMKIAALALVRLGYPIKIDTVGRELWMVFYEVHVNGTVQQLAALWRANGTREGTTFHIIGYRGDAYDDRFVQNLPQASILHRSPARLESPIRRYNLLMSNPQGRIYARDIFLTSIDSPWSYNLWGFEMAPDRYGPKSEEEMDRDVGRTWATVTDVGLIEKLMGMLIEPALELRFESHRLHFTWMGEEPDTRERYEDFITENKALWQEAWKRKAGADAVLRTNSDLDSAITHLGYRSVSVYWHVADALGKALLTDRALVKESQDRLKEAQVIPDRELPLDLLRQLTLARAIASVMAAGWDPVGGVYAAIIPPASPNARTIGMYGRTTKTIFIKSSQLVRGSHTIDTLLHELAHHISGADDLTEAHSQAMTSLAGELVMRLHRGEFDVELAGVYW